MPWTTSDKVMDFRSRHAAIDVLVDTLDGWRRHISGRNASVLAFFGFLSIFPLMLAATTILGFVLEGKNLTAVVRVHFGTKVITSRSPSDWQTGYYLILSPTRIQVVEQLPHTATGKVQRHALRERFPQPYDGPGGDEEE